MKNLISLLTITLFFLSFTIVHQQFSNYKVNNDFTVKIKGTSNVHDWVSTVENLSGSASISFSENGDIRIDECQVSIPVKSIKSSKGSIMNKKTWKALKLRSNPNIEYRLTSFENVVKTGNNFTANVTGKLSIAGENQWINMNVNGKQLNNGGVEIIGSKELKMTDFNIDPPTALMGTMTTGNEITIEFRIILDNE